MGIDDLKHMLVNKIDQVNFADAKKDVMPFLKNPSVVQIWSDNFFKELIKKLKETED